MNEPTQRWLIYALGGGVGHLQRSLSLARAAAAYSVHTTILTNSPWASRVSEPPEPAHLPLRAPLVPSAVRLRVVPPNITAVEAGEVVASLLDGPEPWDAWIVDTFPRGLGGELTPLLARFEGHLVWVHRDLEPNYVAHLQRDAPWELFSTILSPGEAGPLAHLSVHTPPWLLLARDECLPPKEARDYWGVDPKDFLIVVAASGTPKEAAAMERLARNLAAHSQSESTAIRLASMAESHSESHSETHSPRERRSPWPLLASLRGVDLLIGAGGYNTLHETYAASVPAVCLTQPRQYDRQAMRITRAPHAVAADGHNADAVWCAVTQLRQRRQHLQWEQPPSGNGPILNGADDAASIIIGNVKDAR